MAILLNLVKIFQQFARSLYIFIRLFVVHFAVGKVAMATKTVDCFHHYSLRSSFFREVPDSIILYYDSRC